MTNLNKNKLFIISAASGAGKTTIVKELLKKCSNLKVSISHTTRKPRPSEVNGKDYFFTEITEFEKMIEEGLFLEYAHCHGNFYGTSKKSVNSLLENGNDVILEIDWQGAQSIKKIFPEAVSIFIMPPSLEILKERLIERNQDSLEVIETRMQSAEEEISHANEFDYVTINEELTHTVSELMKLFTA
jgi:guanylate kinase